MTHHLNVRVPWHDNRWDGTLCRAPQDNPYCVQLERIRSERDDELEVANAGRHFADLDPELLPPCKAESAAFMSERSWVREVDHPYRVLTKTKGTHGHLKPTKVTVPEFSTFAVPFWWMLRKNQDAVQDLVAEPLPPDEEPPFDSPWVFSAERQEALSQLFFSRIAPGRSLVFLYTKSAQPIADTISRLVVAVGRIERLGKPLYYDSEGSSTYPMWDRLFSHSIRPDGDQGLLLPYFEYLEPTGDPDEDERRSLLLRDSAVIPEHSHIMSFSYAGELSSPDVALSTLVRCLEAVRKIREHGVAPGPWDLREEWLNEEIARAWQDRGAFPGAGSVLEALGMRLGTALTLDLVANGSLGALDDPWPMLDSLLRGEGEPPKPAYEADLEAVANTWTSLSEQRRALVKLLSRFSLSPAQAKRWFHTEERAKATRATVTDLDILENPYRIIETDLGDAKDQPVPIGVIDRGLLPDDTVSTAHPVPPPSGVGSALDPRRVRAALAATLRLAASEGDSLLTETETLERLSQLDLERPCQPTSDWLTGNSEFTEQEVRSLEALTQLEAGETTHCLQLVDLAGQEEKLASILRKRASKPVPSLHEDWESLLEEAIQQSGGEVDRERDRHRRALAEQATALESVTTRRLAALVGRAGTGKTTVLGALMQSARLRRDGILFLAPTGKARVRLAQKASANAMTVAQFLYHLGRYDGLRQRPLFEGKERYQKERTVVIDECSMLTMDSLLAVLLALDLGHVQRVILVGDPNQLPPIGVGRPFADFVALLDSAAQNEALSGALGRLTVEVRTTADEPSDTLRLASWYTREPQPVDADRVLSDLELGGRFNDLSICYWKTPDDLRRQLQAEFVNRLGLESPGDVAGFNRALGLMEPGWVPWDDHDGAERFQVLSPIRQQPFGVADLNRWIQSTYRQQQLRSARNKRHLSLGDEEIVWADKVILLRNGSRRGWIQKTREKRKEYLANGEIGAAALPPQGQRGKFLNVAFTNRPEIRFAFDRRSFGDDGAPLELAYALTVHKAQGSEFGTVFVVLPERSRLLTRELLYTALTRGRDHLVLLIQGEDPSFLYTLTQRSETARRNTNLFVAGIRDEAADVPFASHLVHRTSRGILVRSKSELAIAEHLERVGLTFEYERVLEGTQQPGRLRPDFSFIDDAGDTILWEHLGMLDRPDYRRSWEWKKAWYEKNGYVEGSNLFTSSEVGGLDMRAVADVAKRVRSALE
jgi:ATP-dependent exoDNAse (exonuclease V) alpha subunit